MKLNKLIIITIAGFSVTNAIAGPFGLTMGMSLKELKVEKLENGNGNYRLMNIPKPHSAFESYIIQTSPKSGLCWVKAIGKDISTSSYGFELVSEFNDMKGKLEKVYGKHKVTDLLMPGSIWKELNEFMMAMAKKERYLMAIWDKDKGSTLIDDLNQIGIIALSNGRDKGYISVEYSFNNRVACEAELAAQEDGAL